MHGKGNLGKWYRLFSSYQIPCYIIFDNDASTDRDGTRRKDALSALSLEQADIDAALSEQAWAVTETFCVFGQDFERAMRSHFPTYAQSEVLAKQQGIEAKPFVARSAIRGLVADSAPGWDKVRALISAFEAKLLAQDA